MLSSQGTGKYLKSTWHNGRARAMRDGSDIDQTWLELTDDDVSGKHSKESYETVTAPIHPDTEPHTRDIREVPKRQ